MSSASTEGTQRDWRYGSTQAERLCAALLRLESFEDVDPQHPLGGPDGLKDVRCNRNRKVWIAAAYFPSTPPSFKDVQTKFEHDFARVTANAADGLAFFVNQRLTIGERALLQAAAGAAPSLATPLGSTSEPGSLIVAHVGYRVTEHKNATIWPDILKLKTQIRERGNEPGRQTRMEDAASGA